MNETIKLIMRRSIRAYSDEQIVTCMLYGV